MDPTGRYFINKLQDYTGGSVKLDNEELLIERVMEHANDIGVRWQKRATNCHGGLYIGLAGAAYTLERLSHVPKLAPHKKHLFEMTKEMLPIINHDNANSRIEVSSFMLGNLGVYAVNAVIYKELGKKKESKDYAYRYNRMAQDMMDTDWDPGDGGGDELLVGRASYLAGALWLEHRLGEATLEDEEMLMFMVALLESGEQQAKDHKSGLPLMYHYYQEEYFGAAHGMAGIMTMLLCFSDWYSDRPYYWKLIKKTLDGLVALQKPNGNFPGTMKDLEESESESEDEMKGELVHWCHGAPGFVYMLVRGYMVYKDPKYLDSALKCGELTWEKGLLTKGPGICHGIAGSGYVFLTLYRATDDPKHLHRAIQFYNFMYTEEFKEARIPDNPYSLFEGVAGKACFMADLLNPKEAHFPFFNIF